MNAGVRNLAMALLLGACSDRGPSGVAASSSGSSSTSDAKASTSSATSGGTDAIPDTDTDTDTTAVTSGIAEDTSTTGAENCVVDRDDAPICTSRTLWTDGDEPSTLMRPGVACNECHLASGGAPEFAIAGTVYPTLHEPDDCYGASGAMGEVLLRITGSDGAVLDLPVGTSGNFYASISAGIVFPVRAEVVFDGRIRTMCAWQTNGDCNTCHTETGTNGAQGRVRLP